MRIRPPLIPVILIADAALLTFFSVTCLLLAPYPGRTISLNGLFPIWLSLASLLSATLPSWRLLARTLLIADALVLIWIASLALLFGQFSPGLYVFGILPVVLALASTICAVLLWAPAPAG